MSLTTVPNKKSIILDDPEACLLVKRRAVEDQRSARKTLAITIKEALNGRYGDKCTAVLRNSQA